MQPTPQQLQDLLFAWRVAKFVKSNAIVFCRDGMTVGVGAGQMSRIDSARIAAIKAQNAGLTLAASVVASDAFFPFRDGLDVVVGAGARAVIQPGGSMRDEEVIAAADEQGIAWCSPAFAISGTSYRLRLNRRGAEARRANNSRVRRSSGGSSTARASCEYGVLCLLCELGFSAPLRALRF